jgi:hypothetical protein
MKIHFTTEQNQHHRSIRYSGEGGETLEDGIIIVVGHRRSRSSNPIQSNPIHHHLRLVFSTGEGKQYVVHATPKSSAAASTGIGGIITSRTSMGADTDTFR